MNEFYLVALLLVGVIVVKQLVPRIPEAFLLIAMGWGLSFMPVFHNFKLEPEFFMLLIIAPLMFIDGQKQSFANIRKRFQGIFLLSVVLAVVTAVVVGLITKQIEAQWTFPLALALAAIVTPTDAVAVKSMTGSNEMPKGVGEALELESLFNDATGLVLLDLALSVLSKGTFSVVQGIGHFLFVAVGGVVIGIIGGFLLVMLRFNLNRHGKNPELTTIPISLLTPFAIYLLAEHFGVSGILAVVATGIEHNWEADRLRLTSTNVQLTSRTIWSILSDILNDFVFLILGISLPEVARNVTQMGWRGALALLGVSVLIYVAMWIVRYAWVLRGDSPWIAAFFGDPKGDDRPFFARLFAVSGIHGTVTLAMAFSLPNRIAGHAFPYRNELIAIATFVILISMVMSAIVLPRKLPQKTEAYTMADLDHIRNKMVDYVILQMRSQIEDHAVREALTDQLQSQKSNRLTVDRAQTTANYTALLSETKEVVDNFLHCDDVNERYSPEVVNLYDRIFQRVLVESKRDHLGLRMKHTIKHWKKELFWHTSHRVITKKQRLRFHAAKMADNPQYSERVETWQATRDALLALNSEVTDTIDQYLDTVLTNRLKQKHSDNDFVYLVRRTMNHFCAHVKHDYQKSAAVVPDILYVQAFQHEYDFVQQGINAGYINQSIAGVLYTEINQAQLLQLQQFQGTDMALIEA
ncbi:sodium:proton antiporter [Latilactobacillus curvatus]|uniref:cation:proton antiporter n=1 Tax=Latilactobacillus curvatus TaxID=28038 RepID=UPI0024111739|nr:sodium:proton antiporter [Latilactobacillus curvatus]MDG2979241.1 sodium:proton antiporter [Latilactobacillus curvatus]